MNCKPGDTAYIVGGRFDGMVVRVTTIDTVPSPCGRPLWFYEGFIADPDGIRYESLWDHILRPIRDQDGADETLSWKQVPAPKQKEHA